VVLGWEECANFACISEMLCNEYGAAAKAVSPAFLVNCAWRMEKTSTVLERMFFFQCKKAESAKRTALNEKSRPLHRRLNLSAR
jgi:hypothetical protein